MLILQHNIDFFSPDHFKTDLRLLNSKVTNIYKGFIQPMFVFLNSINYKSISNGRQ